jgi:hypothetical protein
MAAPANASKSLGDYPAHDDTRVQVNNLIDAFRVLVSKLDSDGGVSATDYASTTIDSALTYAPVKII